MTNPHSAAGPAAGFYYQSVYALVLLLDTPDDNAVVSVETLDDVVLDANGSPSLLQLKHSVQDSPPKLSVKSDNFWKTLSSWTSHHLADPSAKFVLVTVAEIVPNDPLEDLTTNGSRVVLLNALVDEAKRVTTAVTVFKKSAKKGDRQPYPDRHDACEQFLQLSPAQQASLIDAVAVRPDSFTLANSQQEVAKRLSLFPDGLRLLLAERLLEWFDRQVALGLATARQRAMSKSEVIEILTERFRELDDDSLPNDFGGTIPPEPGEVLLPDIATKQIHLVSSSTTRTVRAGREYWRATQQRDRWLRDRLSTAAQLDAYDQNLVEQWRDRHNDIRDATEGTANEVKRIAGADLLDWSHYKAPNEIPSLKPNWDHPFLVRGTYQMLSDDCSVGWHPDYVTLLGGKADDDSND